MLLKESSVHFEAYKHARKIVGDDYPSFLLTQFYWQKLYLLDSSLVTVSLPGERGPDAERIFVSFLYPWRADEYTSLRYVPDDVELELDLLGINLFCPMTQAQAAEFCEVSPRTVQRWHQRGLDPIVKMGREVIYDESSLLWTMDQVGHVRKSERKSA